MKDCFIIILEIPILSKPHGFCDKQNTRNGYVPEVRAHAMEACNEQNGNLHKRLLKVRSSMKPASKNLSFVPHHSFSY